MLLRNFPGSAGVRQVHVYTSKGVTVPWAVSGRRECMQRCWSEKPLPSGLHLTPHAVPSCLCEILGGGVWWPMASTSEDVTCVVSSLWDEDGGVCAQEGGWPF